MKRNCPKCNQEINYKSKTGYENGKTNNTLCLVCRLYGENNPSKRKDVKRKLSMQKLGKLNPQYGRYGNSNSFGGKKHTEDSKKKMSNALKGRKFSDETIQKMRNRMLKNNPMKGKKLSEDQKYNLRIKTIEDLEKKGITGKCRNYNIKACQYFDNLNKENGWNLQHAQNGGEQIFCGYFLDAYDKEKNIIVEYDEPKHEMPYWKEKDVKRQNNIIRFLAHKNINVTFLRYSEKNKTLYHIN